MLQTVNAVLNASELVDCKIKNGERFENGKMVPILEDGKKIADPTLAKELLPTQEGFFFGSTDYDQWYVEDLELTKSIVEQALAAPDNLQFHYESSW